MEREAIVIPEKKKKIEKIKKKYKNMSMSDDTANKIQRLEITNKILKSSAIIVGIITAIDIIIPDPIPGIDEAVLTGCTTLLGMSSGVVENKIKDLAENGSADIQMDEIKKLSGQATQIANSVKAAKASKVSPSR